MLEQVSLERLCGTLSAHWSSSGWLGSVCVSQSWSTRRARDCYVRWRLVQPSPHTRHLICLILLCEARSSLASLLALAAKWTD